MNNQTPIITQTISIRCNVKRLRHALQLIQVTITTSSIHFTGGTSTNTYIRLYLLLLRLRLSGLYSLHSCSHFASEGWKVEMTRLGKGWPPTQHHDTLDKEKGKLTTTNTGQTSTQGMAVPHKWVGCLESASSTLRHHDYIKLDPSSSRSSFYSMAFLAYMTLWDFTNA